MQSYNTNFTAYGYILLSLTWNWYEIYMFDQV